MSQADNNPSSPKTILILGGSYAGLSTAHYLLKHCLPSLPPSSHHVTLISTSSQAICRPACPRAMLSPTIFPQSKLFVSIPAQFQTYSSENFTFIQGTATTLDHHERKVAVQKGEELISISFHALVLATGASTPSPLLGLNQDEEFLRKNWSTFRSALSSATTIVIAGAGPAGVETAGELGEFLNGRARFTKSKLSNPKMGIKLLSSESRILPSLRPSIGAKAEAFLVKVGVEIVKNARVASVEPQSAGTDDVSCKAKLTLSDGRTLEADIYIPATGMRPNTSFVDASLLKADRRIDVDPGTLRVKNGGPRIYAIGDASSYAPPAIHHILSAVPVLCANIKRDLLLACDQYPSSVTGDRLCKHDKRETQLVPIGTSKGVGAAMGYELPSILVWLIKGRDYWLWTTGGLWSGKQWAKET
ncbi:FAD/NAD(P)-binding domain-containing protein [Lojkania enalia]|uniref:FAD/NAD(P)-binding domain-containing protein n=1 Tax=Lojkania enalia TaxID=147567 RepID=A0A9P4JZM7_9PLEO|nr:FAD/NAD(P)-binding domain-containing protein [Didymosphaeria enalia]